MIGYAIKSVWNGMLLPHNTTLKYWAPRRQKGPVLPRLYTTRGKAEGVIATWAANITDFEVVPMRIIHEATYQMNKAQALRDSFAANPDTTGQ